MVNSKYNKITETGPQSFRNLLELNNPDYQVDEYMLSSLRKLAPIIPLHSLEYNSPTPIRTPMLNEETGDYFGNSRYDLEYLTDEDLYRILENPNQLRAEVQPWYDQLGAGILKGTALAGTTFLDGVGLLYGIGSAIVNQDAGEIFNNKLSTSLREFNQYMEEALPVYRTLDEIENPMALRNLFSMSTIADDFIKNMGFTVGAFYSGNAYLSALKGLGNLVKAGKMSATASKLIGSTLSGINEGRIEAGNLYDEKVRQDTLVLQETYRPLVLQIMNKPDTLIKDPETGIAISSRQLKLQQLLNRYKQEEDAIKQRATNAGVMDLIFNSVYLPMTNYYTYGKLYARKSNLSKDLANKVGRSIDNVAEQASKEEIYGNRIIRDAAGKYVTKPISKGQSVLKGTKIFATEGSEEMNQALFQSLSTNYYTPDSPDAYYQALTNDEYEAKTKDFLTSLTTAIGDSWGNPTAYKEFLIGGLNGIIGMPTFGKINNSDYNTWLGRGKMIGMSGGMFGEMSSDAYYNRQAQEATNKMNAFYDKVNNAKMFFTRSQSFTDAMDGYSELDDRFEFQNAKDNDLFNVIDAYGRTGRMQDLRDLVNEDFEDLSEERLKEIAEDTESPTNEWRNVDGSSMADTEEGKAEMIEKLEDRRKTILDGIKSYEKALSKVRSIANNSLTEDLNAELAWLAWKLDRFTDRFNSIKENQNEFTNRLAKATHAFLRGRGLGILTLNEADVNPLEEIVNEETGEIETREKSKETRQKEVLAGLNLKKSMEVVSLFLDMINEAESPLQLSYFVKNNPEITQFIDNIGYDLLEGIVPMDYEEFKEGMKALKDVSRIATAHKSFSDRYKEFVDNPSKVIQNRLNIEEKKQLINNVRNRGNVAETIRNTSIGDLAREADNGNVNLDDILSQMEEMLYPAEGSTVTPDLNAYQAEIDKVREAQLMQQTRDDLINGIMLDDSLSEQQQLDALDLISAGYNQAQSIDDFTSLDMEAYQDFRNLLQNESSDAEELSTRLDEANNAIHQHLQQSAQRKEAALNLPNSSDTETPVVDRGTTSGRDPQDNSESELERIDRENAELERNAREESRKQSNNQLWNTLTRSAFGLEELPPLLANDIDGNLKPLVEDSIKSGLSNTLIAALLQDVPVFKQWNQHSNGALGRAISLYIANVRNPLVSTKSNNEIQDASYFAKDKQENGTPILKREGTNLGDTLDQKRAAKQVTTAAKNATNRQDFYDRVRAAGIAPTINELSRVYRAFDALRNGNITEQQFEDYLTPNAKVDNSTQSRTEKKPADRGAVTPKIETPTITSAPNIENNGLPMLGSRYNYLAPSMRKTIPNRDGELLNWEDSGQAKRTYPESTLNVLKAIRRFLELRGAFDTVDSNGVKVGDKLSLVIYPELTNETGLIIIFLQTSDGKIVGDLPNKLVSSFKNYTGLDKLTDKVEKAYNEWVKDNPDKPFIYDNQQFEVILNLVGRVLHSKEYKTLNTIFGSNLKLGLCLSLPNQPTQLAMLFDGGKTLQSRTTRDNSIMMPLRPINGMPYVLIETSDPTRKYIPVPFRMARYDGNNNTLFGRAIHSTVIDILNKEGGNSIALKDALLDLVALDDAYLEYNDTDNTITFRVKGQGAAEFKTIINNEPLTTEGLKLRIIDSLKDSPYQVSRKYINGKYEFYENGIPIEGPYNAMIGEIATANIVEGKSHTQGDWFITEPATGKSSRIITTRSNPNQNTPTRTFSYNGNYYTIVRYNPEGVETWEILDAQGKTIQNEAARGFGYGMYKGYDMTRLYNVPWSVEIDINGQKVKTSTYSPKTRKYITQKTSEDLDVSAFLALIRAEEGKESRHLPNPFVIQRGTGVPLKVQLEIAQANIDFRREKWQYAPPTNEQLAQLFPNGFSEDIDESVAVLDRINSEIQAIINEKPSRKASLEAVAKYDLYRDKWRQYYKDLEQNTPQLSEIDRAIAEAVWKSRKDRYKRDYNAEIEKTLSSFNLTPAYSEESYEGTSQQVITLPRAGVQTSKLKLINEISYKVGDNLKGLNGIWTIQSINDDGSVNLKSMVSEAVLKISSVDELDTYKFTVASLEDIIKALEEIQKEIEKPITTLEVKEITKNSLNKQFSAATDFKKENPTVQQVLDNFAGYYEGGGRAITDDYPGFNEQLSSKFENFVMGAGLFTENDAIEFLNEITRISNAKETGVKIPNPELDELSPAELKEQATKLGLLGNAKRNKVWDTLTPKALNVLINLGTEAKNKILILERAYSDKRGINLRMLGASSVEDFLDSKPKYMKSDNVSETFTWDENKETNWLAKALPQFAQSDRLKIVETLKTLDGRDAYGLFWKSIITIARNAIKGALYHEAFHGVVNSLLTEQEYTGLFNAAIEQYGNLNIEELEERLAEDFRRYMKLLDIPVVGGLVKIFRKLKHWILKLIGNEPYINKLFYDINNGKYATRGLQETDVLRYSMSATARLQSILESTINNPIVYPIRYNTFKSDVIRLNAAWGRWRDKMETLYNVTIKGYRDNKTNKWIVASVTPKGPKYLKARYVIEMNNLRKDAIASGDIVLKEDGSFNYALAPNRKKSNLNERQWLQVRTKAFKDWFGDWQNNPENASKVVDENGEPLVVYHGTNAEFSVFKQKDMVGIFFTPEKKDAKSYGDNIKEVFLNVRDLYNTREANFEHLKLSDGTIDPNYNNHYTVKNPNQIKSVTDNEGDFDTLNANIYDLTETDKQQQHKDNFMFEFLSNEDKQFVLDKVGLEEYNKMSLNMKEVLLHCK